MLKENLHIVFGKVGRRTLTDSNILDPNKCQVINFDDMLNIGPVCDINANPNIQKRKDWLQQAFGDISNYPVEEDIKNIETIIEYSCDMNALFFWTGLWASEIVSTARLLSHLSKLDKPVFIANFNTPVKSIHGNIIYPKALNQTATFQVKNIFEQFQPIEKSGLIYWIDLWEKVKLEKGKLWIRDSKGQIIAEKTDYFDSFLLANCNDGFQKAARVIGETLADIDSNVGDDFLNWRLKQLVLSGKIEAMGRLDEIRDYEVKKYNSQTSKLPSQ